MSSPAKLTDTQRAILFEASKRKDRCLIAPKTLKGAATQKVAAKLLKAGLVSEIKARSGMEIRRRTPPAAPESIGMSEVNSDPPAMPPSWSAAASPARSCRRSSLIMNRMKG